MKLHFAAASPFVRKVRAVADELGLSGQIELIAHPVSPIHPLDALNADNPLGKIPALVLNDGTTVLYDSAVITDYLNAAHGFSLRPSSGDSHWRDKVLEALADGICEAGVLARYETAWRPEDKQFPEWIRNQLQKGLRAVDRLEETASSWTGQVTIGSIAVACALAYLDFRFAELNWRQDRPSLTGWFDRFAQRPCMTATKPE